MKTRKEDGTLRPVWDIMVELEARLLPIVQTAYVVINGSGNTDEAHALACGVQHYLDDLKDAMNAMDDWQMTMRQAEKAGGE